MHQFSSEDLYDIESLLNDAIFAARKRLQHSRGQIDLNVPGASAGIYEGTEEECKARVKEALAMYDKVYQIRCESEALDEANEG